MAHCFASPNSRSHSWRVERDRVPAKKLRILDKYALYSYRRTEQNRTKTTRWVLPSSFDLLTKTKNKKQPRHTHSDTQSSISSEGIKTHSFVVFVRFRHLCIRVVQQRRVEGPLGLFRVPCAVDLCWLTRVLFTMMIARTSTWYVVPDRQRHGKAAKETSIPTPNSRQKFVRASTRLWLGKQRFDFSSTTVQDSILCTCREQYSCS